MYHLAKFNFPSYNSNLQLFKSKGLTVRLISRVAFLITFASCFLHFVFYFGRFMVEENMLGYNILIDMKSKYTVKNRSTSNTNDI